MIRRFFPRLRLLKTFNPIRASPLIPLTTRIGLHEAPITLIQLGRPSTRLFTQFSARLTPSPSEPQSPLDDRPSLPADASLSQRLKHLIKSYGWYALGMYIVLSAADFGIAFAGVNLLGAEHVSRVAASVKDYVFQYLPAKPIEPGREEMEPVAGGGSSHEGLYAMIVLAYTIHKTLFLPIRIGLTAALTPKLVGWLGRRGWAGGAGTKRAAQEMRERMRNPKNHG